MNKLLLALLTASSLAMLSSPAMARRGADDPVGHVRQCRGCDDPAGHVSGRDRVRTPRAVDNSAARRGADDPAGHVRGQHADGHVSGRDRVRAR